ncbi:fungal-specific transcription factor domain-containing protein [Suillus clintonianus]|uniref:fungal-specific transcription factor domain-containing protein n=1 Tax=Suillus clintonianus TaxID=1904413 RepID=UPI001B884CEB|nr:fungal-specific transcription factor domain-containing protein [Suillus clintonianus]KAG2136039.1 fungal-specific transcription factor domain-containing protein [Suillus clintonianus]
MPPGKGSRFVGVAEDYLRHKAAKLEERMRSLEDALAILQVNTSTPPHPLLAKIWSSEEADNGSSVDTTPTRAEFNLHGLIDSLGSLHLDGDPQSGASRFFGPSGGSESLLLAAKRAIPGVPSSSTEEQEIDADYLPSHISALDKAFPFTPSGLPKERIREMIESYLPSIQRAVSLCETFLKSLSWMFQIVSRQQIIDHLIPLIYRPGIKSLERPRYGPHDLALLFSVLAIGALVDPALPPYNAEARHYQRMARAALCLQSVFSERSVVTLKVLHLMSVYYGMSGVESNLELCYSLLNLAGQAALQIGFHKDPSRWGFEGREAYERRSYFWTLFSQTLWQSLVTGRPPVIMPAVVDCQIPSDCDEATYQSGEIPIGFGNWSSRYTMECLASIIELTQAAKPPDYQTVLELDRKIREFSVPVFTDSTNFDRTPMEMRSFAQSRYRELTLMFLHRGFFAQAMSDFPSDPLRSPLGRSFMVAYQCASILITTTINQFTSQPVLCSRVWRIWSFAFSASVIVGTVAIRRLGIKLDPDPFEHLERACSLFHEAAQTSSRAKKALPILLRLRQKAVHARMDPLQHVNHLPSSESEDEPDELEVFGGRTILVTKSCKQVSRTSQLPIQLASSTATQNKPPNQRDNYQSHLNIPSVPEGVDYTLEEGTVGLPELELLHREVSGPLYSRSPCAPSLYGPQQGQQGDLVLEDRWSSFVHNASLPPGYFSHLGPQAR